MSTPDRPEQGILAEFAGFLEEFAEVNLDASGVPEEEKRLFRELRRPIA